MNNEARLTKVVVVGRDAALWLAANTIQRALGSAGVKVQAVELPTLLRTSDLYASLPALEALHNKLGLDEAALLGATGGSFSLGQNFVDLSGIAPSFFHASASYGAQIDGNAFFPYWVKARHFGLAASFEDFCLSAVAAKQGRMLLPDEATEAFGRTDYGYHLPAIAYVGMLKALASQLGVVMHQTRDITVQRDSMTGTINAVTLDGAHRIDGELFIDATGAEALLIGRALDVQRESWRSQFIVDRRLTARAVRFASIPSYTEVRASSCGWTALYPSQAATYVTHSFASSLSSDEDALNAAASASALLLSDPVVEVVDAGRYSNAWEGNCIAVGEAACAFDPIHDVPLQAIQLGLVNLLSLFPVTGRFAAERTEYNRIIASAMERIRDFQSAFYVCNNYGDTPFWTQARTAVRSDALVRKMTTFAARGDIAPFEDETFSSDSWHALFIGLGLIPESWSPGIDRTSPEIMKQEFRRILRFIKDQVLKQPTHDRYLESFCRREAA